MSEDFGLLVQRVDLLSSQVAELTEAVSRLAARLEPASTAPSSYELVGSYVDHRAPSVASLGGASSSVASSSALYNELAAEIPPVPENLVRDCSVLSGGSFTPFQRAERAWKIGCWARFCLEGRIQRPRPSAGIDLANQCYIVLRAPGFEVPLLALRAADYRHVVGDFKSSTISHGFPSQKEARVYCEAAGVRFPDPRSTMATVPVPQVSSIAEGVEELFILSFPLDVPVEEAFAGYALVVMRRDGGALLALPVGLIAMEALQTVSLEDPASDLGPHTVVPVPGVREADGSLQLLGSDLDVLLVDVSDAVVANLVPMELSELDPTSVLGFHEEVSYLPDAATLLKLTKEWVASATAERVQFYSADEGGPAEEQTAVPKQKAKAKASSDKPKTVSAAKQVASHSQQISSLLPNMASQLAEIQEEQKNMREAFRLQNMLPPPRGTQTPVTMPMQSFAKMLGAPPRTKQVTFVPPPPKKTAVELDSALNVQEQAEEGDHLSERSPLAMAMPER